MAADRSAGAKAEPGLVQLSDENALLRASLAEMRDRVEELERDADADLLTPLPGRSRFLKDLKRVASQVARHGEPAALIRIDLAPLGAINDRHGRLAGDAALIHAAKLLQGLIRAGDVIARIGGDSFGLILDRLDHDSAIETAERLSRCIAAHPLDLGGRTVPLHAVAAVATILPGDAAADVMRRADHNMRRAKAEL